MKNPDSDTKLKREHDDTQKKIAADRALKRQDWNKAHKKSKKDE